MSNSSNCFLRQNLVERPSSDYIHCGMCRNRVALVSDNIRNLHPVGIFNRVFNVDVNDHETVFESTIANVYCVHCKTKLGWKFITVHQPKMYVREGRFFMNLYKLTLSNDAPLLRFNEEQHGNVTDQDGDGDSTDQDGDTTDGDGDSNEQDLGANKENADLDEEVPNEQDLGTNEQNADQDGGGNGQNADQDGGSN